MSNDRQTQETVTILGIVLLVLLGVVSILVATFAFLFFTIKKQLKGKGKVNKYAVLSYSKRYRSLVPSKNYFSVKEAYVASKEGDFTEIVAFDEDGLQRGLNSKELAELAYLEEETSKNY